ncbi:MAG: M23 family metallopeptidase [Crocinitomicaceae bacterium]|nr:M23 family metallopeptidase [Crocinitomicaceae bacterium]
MHKILFIFTLLSIYGFSQPYEAKNIDFENIGLLPPMKIPLILSGNFCEMRSNHWHTGLDIKTQGVEGIPLYAVDEGVISRVRVSPWGYGLAVYIDHPNGLTSVYAHMQSFSSTIDSLVYAVQKETESYVVNEMVLERGVQVKRGEFIGKSGNSGSSAAAHLHFELRETKTEHALNPLKFKCYRKKIHDTTKPTLKGIKVYAVTDKGYMIPGKSKYYYVKLVEGKYILNDNLPIDINDIATKNAYLAFGFHVTDKLDGAGNVCGIHHAILSKGEEKLHEHKTDYMNFDHNRFINSHQDYYEFTQNRRNIHKAFKTVVNPMPIYLQEPVFVPFYSCDGTYNFKALDVHGNYIVLNFDIAESAKSFAKNPFDKPQDYYFPDSVNTLLHPNFQLLMEPGTFYEPLQKMFRIDSAAPYLSYGYEFSESDIPVQKNFDVRMKVPDLPADFPTSKLGIGVISTKGYLSWKGGDYINGWVESNSRDFGKFVLLVDTIAPKITPLDFNENKTITRYRTMELKIEDNLAGVWQYKAFINGEWVLMEYDRRKMKYIIPLDERSKHLLKTGKNEIKIFANDGKGNKTEASWNVIY